MSPHLFVAPSLSLCDFCRPNPPFPHYNSIIGCLCRALETNEMKLKESRETQATLEKELIATKKDGEANKVGIAASQKQLNSLKSQMEQMRAENDFKYNELNKTLAEANTRLAKVSTPTHDTAE